jgi:hypothetical protein
MRVSVAMNELNSAKLMPLSGMQFDPKCLESRVSVRQQALAASFVDVR